MLQIGAVIFEPNTRNFDQSSRENRQEDLFERSCFKMSRHSEPMEYFAPIFQSVEMERSHQHNETILVSDESAKTRRNTYMATLFRITHVATFIPRNGSLYDKSAYFRIRASIPTMCYDGLRFESVRRRRNNGLCESPNIFMVSSQDGASLQGKNVSAESVYHIKSWRRIVHCGLDAFPVVMTGCKLDLPLKLIQSYEFPYKDTHTCCNTENHEYLLSEENRLKVLNKTGATLLLPFLKLSKNRYYAPAQCLHSALISLRKRNLKYSPEMPDYTFSSLLTVAKNISTKLTVLFPFSQVCEKTIDDYISTRNDPKKKKLL
jgi:hypothetical protein